MPVKRLPLASTRLPTLRFTGTVADISPLAKVDFSGGWPPVKNFDLVVTLDHVDDRLRPGMSVTERIAVQRIPNVILIPTEAVFNRNGRDVVYVEQGIEGQQQFRRTHRCDRPSRRRPGGNPQRPRTGRARGDEGSGDQAMRARTRLRIVIGVLVVVGAGLGINYSLAKIKSTDHGTPTIRVAKGNVDLKVYVTGELRTPNTSILIAPPVGGTLQIVKFARTGDVVKAGDVVLEFDPSEQEYNLEQAQSALDQADQQITKNKADAAISISKDQVDLLHAHYDVRRAELDVSQNELKSAIDAKKNDLALEEAKRRLAQLEEDSKSRAASNAANLSVYMAQRAKAQMDIKLAQDRITNMVIKAPISGLFARKSNTSWHKFLHQWNDPAGISGRRSDISGKSRCHDHGYFPNGGFHSSSGNFARRYQHWGFSRNSSGRFT